MNRNKNCRTNPPDKAEGQPRGNITFPCDVVPFPGFVSFAIFHFFAVSDGAFFTGRHGDGSGYLKGAVPQREVI